jgi:hypothetical protein
VAAGVVSGAPNIFGVIQRPQSGSVSQVERAEARRLPARQWGSCLPSWGGAQDSVRQERKRRRAFNPVRKMVHRGVCSPLAWLGVCAAQRSLPGTGALFWQRNDDAQYPCALAQGSASASYLDRYRYELGTCNCGNQFAESPHSGSQAVFETGVQKRLNTPDDLG